MLPIRVRPDAVSDIESICRWYRDQRDDLADEFRRAVRETLTRIQNYPESYPRLHADLRRAALHRFPYGVFYTIENKTIVIHAVFHDRRDPRLWQGRVGE